MLKDADEIQRIKAALNRGRLERNLKTAIILLAASSGALVSQPVLAATATGTLISLLLANMIKSKQSRDNQSSL
jgi:hypothetical protein